MFFGTWNQRNESAFQAWEDEEKKKKKVVADPVRSVTTGEVSFKQANRMLNNRFTTTGFKSTSGNENSKSYKWEKKYLYDLPRSYGRSYNDKFENYAKHELGMSKAESNDFRKYLDAKEKGGLEDWGTNSMVQTAMERAYNKGKENVDNSPIVPAQRTRLDRVFDTLLAGNYFSANLVNNMSNKHEGWLDALKHAGKSTLRASNPFGDGSTKDEMIYSKVMDNAGWKPKGKLGKFTRGTVGLAADIMLDPTTYATFGVGALLKGAGKASISGTKLLQGAKTLDGISDASKALIKKGTMSKEIAEKIVTERNAKLGKELTSEELTRQAENFQQRFHELVGTNRKNVGVGVGLKHSPLNPMLKALSFGNKTVNKLADFHVELPGSRQALETLSKVSQIDKVYAGTRKMIYGTKMSKLFSTKSGLHKLASQDPARIYDFMHMMERSKGVAGDKIAHQKSIMEYARQNLQDLSPSDMKQIVDALQDKTLVAPIKRMVALGSMKEANQVKDRLMLEQQSALEELGKLGNRKAELEDLRTLNINEIDDAHRAVSQAEDEYVANLHTLDMSHLSDTEARQKAVEALKQQADELNARFMGVSSPVKPAEKEIPMMDVPEKPKRPYNKKSDAPVEEPLKPLPEKPVYPDAPKKEDFEKKMIHPVTGKEVSLSDLHQKLYDTVEKWKKGMGKSRKPGEADQTINELSEAIYGEQGKIALVTYPYAVDKLVKMVENGSSPKFIQQYINANKHQYDGRARDMYDLVAHHFKYGKGKKYESWDKYYTERIREIDSRTNMKTGEMSQADWNQYQKLQKDNLERSFMLSQMMQMTPRELKKYITQYHHEEMLQGVRKLGRNVNFEGSFEWKKRKDGTFYGKDESNKIAGQAESDVLESERKKWNDEDFEGNLKNDVGTSSRQEFTDYVDENGQRQIINHQDGIPMKKERTYKLDMDEEDLLRGDLAREITDNGKGKLNSAQYNYIGSVMEHVEPLLKEFFKKDFAELSTDQRKFLVGMAKQHALTDTRGGVKQADKIIADKIKKETEERTKLYEELIHAEAVKARAQVGSPIRYKVGEKEFGGKVIGVNREEVHTRPVKTEEPTTLARGEGVRTEYDIPEYITTYNIQAKDGTIHKSVKPADVTMVNRQKPARILQENSYKSKVDEEFAKAQAEYELKVKALDDAHAKSVEQTKFHNEMTSQVNAKRKAAYEKEKADLKAKYEADMVEYETKRNAMDETMSDVEAQNKASKEEWAQASREASQMADDYIRQSDDMLGELDALHKEGMHADTKYQAMVNSVKADFADLKQKKLDNLADLEKHGDELDRQMQDLNHVMINGRTYDQTLTRIEELRNAFSSNDAWEDYLELNYSDQIEKWDRANGNKNVGKLVLDTRTDMSEKAKRLTLELRGKFNEIADKEVLAGRLEQGQVDGLLNEYLTHVVTSDGKKFFKDFTLSTNELGETIVKERPKSPTHPSVTQDLGFGEEFNNFAMERRIKKLKMPDGTWVERPTIEQINEVMRPYIKGGGNAFSENIADIYLARALKHNNLMFDETYMQEMMRMFGDDLPEGVFSPKKGFKTVMNYGLFKRNVEDIAKLKNSLAMEREIMVHRLEAFKRGEKFDAAAYMKQRGSDDYEKFVQEGYDVLGFNRDSYRTEGTPMLELTPEQVQKVQVWHQGTLDELKGKYKRWFDDAELNRRNGFEVGNKTIEQLMKYNDTLESLTPLEIKQMHGTITDKMNQARKISIAKNQNRVLGMYDKFTHLMKVSQTAMLPSFHVRNMLSNQFQNYLAIGNDVFDTGMQKKVMHVLRSQGDSKKLGAMQPLVVKNAKGETTGVMSWNDIILEAQARGVLDEGFFGAEIGARDKSAGLIKKLQGVKVGKKEVNLDPTSTENTLAKLGTNVGSNVEGHARLMQFVSHIKNGKSAEEAADLVNKYLFDYSDLTHFEQNVMKRIFPYYTWLRKNAKLQLTQMVEQPGKYRDTAKAMNAVESGVDEEDRVETQYLAPFAKDWLQISGFDKDGKTNILNPNMPFQDISRLPNPLDLKQSMEALIPQTNVLPKEILQQATNHDFFFNDKIQKEGEGAGKRLAHALTNYAPGLQIHDLLTKDDKGRQALSTAGMKTLNYDYATAKDVTIAKYLGKYKDKEPATVTKKFMDSLERKDAITVTQQSASRLLDDYINGEDIGKTKAGIFTPFAKVMKEVGLDKAKNREWVSATLDATHLEKYLTGSDFEMAKITKVRDGDTIEVELNGKKEAVRFNLIDTPEIAHQKGEKSMAFGDEAHRNMSRLAGLGKDARLVISKDKDAHGRLVAYVYVDGVDLNKEQLESGNAQLRYVNASENPYNYDEYRKAQTRAFDKRRGVWSIDGYADNKKGTDYNKREAYKRYQK